jgi:hypothetical protein
MKAKLERFFYALKMWSMGREFKRAWEFWDSSTGRMLREKKRGHPGAAKEGE